MRGGGRRGACAACFAGECTGGCVSDCGRVRYGAPPTLCVPSFLPCGRRDADGNSALHHAAFCGLSATFKALHAAGARSYEPSADPGWTAASVLDGVLTRSGARLHRHLTIRGALGHHRGAMLAACHACAVAAGEAVEPEPPAQGPATDPDFDINWALEQIDAGAHQLALPSAQASVAQGFTDSFVVGACVRWQACRLPAVHSARVPPPPGPPLCSRPAFHARGRHGDGAVAPDELLPRVRGAPPRRGRRVCGTARRCLGSR